MRYIFIILLIALATPSFGLTTVQFTVLSPGDLRKIGVTLAIRDLEEFGSVFNLPTNFALTPNDQSNCLLDDVYVSVGSSSGIMIYGSSVARKNGQYHFQIQADNLQYSTISLICIDNSRDMAQETYYKINISEHI